MATVMPLTAVPPLRLRRPVRLAVFSPIYGLTGPVAGLRWWFLSRYLAAAGANVTVFHHTADTGTWQGVPVAGGAAPREVFVPERHPRLARLGLLAGRLVAQAWGRRHGPFRSLVQAATEYLYFGAQSARGLIRAYETAYAESPPDAAVGSFIGWSGVRAALAANERGVPLLLEFRDPWRSYHPHTWRYHERRIHRAVGRAAAVISVTPLLRERDEKEFGKPALYLPHGFPPEVLDSPRPVPAAGPLRVGYYGTIFYPYFDHESWFA